MSGTVASAYSATGTAWEDGPGRIYNRLAEVLVEQAPVGLRGRSVLDLGAGTGAASRAIAAAGGRPVALDVARGMLTANRHRRPPSVQGDVCALPFPSDALDGVVAAFSLNHVLDPAASLRECARVCAPSSPIVCATYAADDRHPVKQAVLDALVGAGFEPEPWAVRLYRDAVPLLAEGRSFEAVGRSAGLETTVRALEVPFPELGAEELVAWRLGMAQHAPFVARLGPAEREALRRRALGYLGHPPVLVRSILVLSAVVS